MIAAIVALYYPEDRAISRLLSSLTGQVSRVFAVDNTPGSASAPPPCIEEFSEFVSYIALGENRGIAAAQNAGIQLSVENGLSHVLLLDQDSFLLPDTAARLLESELLLLERGEQVAAVCPQVIDERTGKRPAAVQYRWCFVRKTWAKGTEQGPIPTDSLIASGSLLRTEVLRTVGPMREDLFIEYVDTEWVFRARSLGYRSFCVPSATIVHRVGEHTMRIMGKDIYLYNVLRYRYKLRNAAYLLRLNTMGWNWRSYAAFIIPYHLMLFSLLSLNRLEALRLLSKSIGDGLGGRLGPIAEGLKH